MPSEDSSHLTDGERKITRRMEAHARDQIERGNTDAFVIVCSFTFDSLEAVKDKRADWHHKYNLAPHIRTLVLKELRDDGWTDIHRFLNENSRAETIGYDPEKFNNGNDAPDRTTISRAWQDYFDDGLRAVIRETCDRIREYARENDVLVGSQKLQAENNQDCSPRTKYRVKRRKAHEAASKFRDLFYDKLELPLPDGAKFEKDDVFDLFLHIALTNDFSNNGAETWAEEVDDESSAPSGSRFRDYITQFNELEDGEVTAVFEEINEVLWEMADERGFLDQLTDVAIDSHSWLFYGDSDTARISNVDPKEGTDKAYEFLTLSVIGDKDEKFVVAVRQVASRQEKIEAVKDLVEEAQERLFVREAMLDRGFYGTLFAQALKETGVNFVIRAQAGYKSKKMWENAEDRVNVERVTMSRSNAPYESVEVTRFVTPARDDADAEYMAFITNRELTERQARKIGKAYKRRWGIETSYRVTGDFLPKTTSKTFGLRVWYYRMAVLLYNVWVVVNAVVTASLGLSEVDSPPVTAKYFLTILRNKHGDQSIT